MSCDRRFSGWVWRAAALVPALGAAGCARPEAPPGGPEDRMPPFVVETVPDTFAIVEAGVREFVFRFSERISERAASGTLNRAVVVSPPAGNVRVRHSRDGLIVTSREGLQEGRVYRITILPVVNDMFGNRLRDPFDLVLSTGGEIVPNVVAGVVEDRVTGQAVADARVQAVFQQAADTVAHWNYTDANGIFALRFVPRGSFRVSAWQDRNRDGLLSPGEPRTLAQFFGELPGVSDTSFVIMSLVEPDTTPARLIRVTAQDSLRVQLEFDDYIDPDLPGSEIIGSVIRQTEEANQVVPMRIFQEYEYETWVADQQDSAAAEAETDESGPAAEGPGPVGGQSGSFGLSGLRLPSQTLVGVPEVSLEASVGYSTAIIGPANIAGVAGQADTVLFTWEPPEPDSTAVDSTAVDSTGVVPDTGDVVLDTTAVVPDTTVLPPGTVLTVPDTTGALPDTTGTPPDTTGTPPDTTGALPDTTGTPPDTTGAPPDTTGALPDTTGTPPDTTGAPPDTTVTPRIRSFLFVRPSGPRNK